MSQVSEQLVAERRRLQASVESLLGAGWTGAAAEDYERGWTEWVKGADDVMTALSVMGDLLAEARASYVASDEEAAARQSQLRNRLG